MSDAYRIAEIPSSMRPTTPVTITSRRLIGSDTPAHGSQGGKDR